MRRVLLALTFAGLAWGADARPKVRAITAFIDIDARSYAAQIEDTVQFLNTARAAYQRAGFEVETIRIVTQPFPRYTKDMSRAGALAFFEKLNALAARLKFSPNIGAVMLHDNDDPAPVDLLIEVLSHTNIDASLVIAAEDGIHWNAIHQTARLIKAVAEKSPHSQGNFNFAATAMVKPYGPFYPGAYHLGGSRAFAVGLEGAGVVAAVFARNRDPRTAEKALAAALAGPMRDAEQAAMQVAAASGWT